MTAFRIEASHRVKVRREMLELRDGEFHAIVSMLRGPDLQTSVFVDLKLIYVFYARHLFYENIQSPHQFNLENGGEDKIVKRFEVFWKDVLLSNDETVKLAAVHFIDHICAFLTTLDRLYNDRDKDVFSYDFIEIFNSTKSHFIICRSLYSRINHIMYTK